jgi:hypothetical protein
VLSGNLYILFGEISTNHLLIIVLFLKIEL